MFALGSHPYLLAVARSLQGASAGTVFTVGLSLLVGGIDRDEVGGWIGLVFSAMTAGLTFAPMLGGIIYAKAGYFAVFAVALAVIAVPFVLCLLYVDPKRGQQPRKSGTAQRDYGTISHGQPRGQVPSDTLQDDRIRGYEDEQSPMINEASRVRFKEPADKESSFLMRHFPSVTLLLSSPRVLAALYGTLIQVSLVTSFDGILPLFVQRTFNWDSSASGAIFIAITMPSLFGGLAGTLSDRVGARVVALVGFVFSAIMIALMCLVNHNSVQQVVLLGALLVLTGSSYSPWSHNRRLLTKRFKASAQHSCLVPSQPTSLWPRNSSRRSMKAYLALMAPILKHMGYLIVLPPQGSSLDLLLLVRYMTRRGGRWQYGRWRGFAFLGFHW